ncbi:hypothetical protein [Thermovibrio sp.]
MTLKQNLYAIIIAFIVVGVSLFALQNFQDVNVSVPFVGVFHTKLFVVIVFSYVAGFLTAGFLSLILKIFSIPSNLRRRRVEDRPVPQAKQSGKEAEPSQGDVRQEDGKSQREPR